MIRKEISQCAVSNITFVTLNETITIVPDFSWMMWYPGYHTQNLIMFIENKKIFDDISGQLITPVLAWINKIKKLELPDCQWILTKCIWTMGLPRDMMCICFTKFGIWSIILESLKWFESYDMVNIIWYINIKSFN